MPTIRTRPISVAETQIFVRAAEKLWNEPERNSLIDYLARNPEAGDLIPGTGGVRKLRWGRAGSGKQGGARVIYFYYRPEYPLYLLMVYAKAQATDLTPDEKQAVAALAAAIKGAADRPRGNER